MHNKLGILELSEEDRPREKLRQKGRSNLSNAELLAILIGSGNKEKNAIELSQEILFSAGNNLHELAKLSIEELMKFSGIGEAKAITVASALELGRRRKREKYIDKPKITVSQDAYTIMTPYFVDVGHEEFWVLSLSKSNKVLKIDLVSTGGISGTVSDPKIVFKKALDNSATSIIVAHNHPSGNPKPSQSDIQITKKLVAGGQCLEIPLLDHIIYTEQGYYSFADEGLL